MTAKPKVSVLMLTYNHEKFIEQAVRSVMMQETDFDYELVIGEDCSTDSTREIVIRLKEEFPDRIRLLLHPQNIGMIPNKVATYDACQGKYIALCEGDDYWTDPKKLQIQVDYMDAHPECRLCFHASRIIRHDPPTVLGVIEPPLTGSLDFRHWLNYRAKHRTYIPTASILFRNPQSPLPEWYLRLQFAGDWPLIVWLLADGGTFHYVNQIMSVYRKHETGATNSLSRTDLTKRKDALRKDLADHLLVSRYLSDQEAALLYPRIGTIYLNLAVDSLELSEYSQARQYLRNASHYFIAIRTIQFSKRFLHTLLRLYTPWLYAILSNMRHQVRITS